MTDKELRELSDWIGKTFNIPFCVDEWILSADGGKSQWCGEFHSKREAENYLNWAQRKYPNHAYAHQSTAHHWQLYPLCNKWSVAGLVLEACCEKAPHEIRAYISQLVIGEDTLRFFVDCGDTILERQNCRGHSESLPIAICLFARKLFQPSI